MADDWITLQNGFRYNQKTGETGLDSKDANNPIYWYSPTTNKTTYGGTTYAGQLDPYVLASITNQDTTDAASQYSSYLDSAFGKLEKNPFIQTEKDVTDAIKPIGSVYNALNMGAAYDAARKRTQGPSFFDEAKTYAASLSNTPSVDASAQEIDRLKGLVSQKYASDPEKAAQFLNPLDASKATPVSQPETPATPPQQTNSSGGLDWKSLYDQLQGLLNSQANNSTNGPTTQTSTPKDVIGSFQQWGPDTIARRQQSYVSSTPYGSKGS